MEVTNLPEIVGLVGEGSELEVVRNYSSEMRERLCQLLTDQCEGVDWGSTQDVRRIFPLVRWMSGESAPDFIVISLVYECKLAVEDQGLPEDLVRQWVDPIRHASLACRRSFLFKFPQIGEEVYQFTQLLIEVRQEKDRAVLLTELPQQIEQLRLALTIPKHAAQLLNCMKVGMHTKMREIYRRIARLRSRWPRQIGPDIGRELLQFSLVAEEQYYQVRCANHMSRLVATWYLFRKRLQWMVTRAPEKRHMLAKFLATKLHYPFGSKNALSLILGVNIDPRHESFDERHILRAVKQIVPDVQLVPSSYLVAQSGDDPVRTITMELEREGGQDFSKQQLDRLRQELVAELKQHVERLTNSVFMGRNDEEVFRAIMTLTKEVCYVRDLPQALIWFHSQTPDDLIYIVVIVRVLGSGKEPLGQLLREKRPDFDIVVEQTRSVGYLRNKYPKEAAVVRFTCSKEPYLRKDHAVDLYRARQFVYASLTGLIGEIRDFNGGLILKQSEVLQAVKRLLTTEERRHEATLESFFYGISPSTLQSYLEPASVVVLFRLFLEIAKGEVPRQMGYLLLFRETEEAVYAVARADEESFRDEMLKVLKGMHLTPLQLAHSFVNVHGSYCLSMVCLNKERTDDFQEALVDALEAWVQRQRSRQVVRINLSREKASLDPRIANGRRSAVLVKMLYEGLTRIDRREGRPALAIAEHIEMSHDLRRYTFHLRESYWSDGTPLTAHDFEYAWKKTLDPDFSSRYSYLFHPIQNAEAAKKGEVSVDEVGIHSEHSRKLTVELKHPTPYFLDLVAHAIYSPLCRKLDEKRPGWTFASGDEYVCNGPFMLAESDPNQRIRVVKNPRYWEAKSVRLEEIDISMIEDPAQALARLEREELDWVGEPLSELPASGIDRLAKERRLQTQPAAAVYWYKINVSRFPFTSVKIRRAFCYAIDRQRLIDRVLKGCETPAFSILPPTMVFGNSAPTFRDGDVEAARRLFTEGLNELGTTAEQLPPIVLSYSSVEGQDVIANEVAQQWEDALGITVRTEGISWKSYLDHTLAQNYQIAGVTWYSWCNDPIYNLEHVKHRNSPLNATRWEHPKYMQLLDESDACLDLQTRKAKLREAELLLLEELPIIPVYYHCHRFVKSAALRDVYISNFGQIDFKWAYKEYRT